ncbi:MAG: hypothetical protein LPK26_07640 [Bacillaceae bacterium]|nr:hypothetical protein [Bacillaceae bacterium]
MNDGIKSLLESLIGAIPFIVFGVLLIKSKDQKKTKETGTPTNGIEILLSFLFTSLKPKHFGYLLVLIGISIVVITFFVNFL